MTLEEKVDKLLAQQLYTNKLLETIIEGMPDPQKNAAKVRAVLSPIMEMPIIKNNPAFKDMLDAVEDIGGK